MKTTHLQILIEVNQISSSFFGREEVFAFRTLDLGGMVISSKWTGADGNIRTHLQVVGECEEWLKISSPQKLFNSIVQRADEICLKDDSWVKKIEILFGNETISQLIPSSNGRWDGYWTTVSEFGGEIRRFGGKMSLPDFYDKNQDNFKSAVSSHEKTAQEERAAAESVGITDWPSAEASPPNWEDWKLL